MENKITITEELKAANAGKLNAYEVGQVVEYSNTDTECEGNCSGHWVKIGGMCVCNPAPEEQEA